MELHLCMKENEPSFKTGVRWARSLELKVGFRIILKATYPVYQVSSNKMPVALTELL